jgi:hypothetical protein
LLISCIRLLGLQGHNKSAQGIALGFQGIALGFQGIALGFQGIALGFEWSLYRYDLQIPRLSCQKKKEFVLSEWRARVRHRADVLTDLALEAAALQ